MSDVKLTECSKFLLQVVRHGETEPQYASRLVWWIAHLADWATPVKVGDTVVEVTHRMGMTRLQLGLHSAIGELLRIENQESEYPTYVIRDIEGKERQWTNAKICLVESSPAKESTINTNHVPPAGNKE